MILTNLPYPQNKNSEVIGVVDGTVIRGFSLLRSITSGIKSIFGVNLEEIEDFFEELRKDAILKMMKNAKILNANEIINVRIDVSEISRQDNNGFIICYAYGTAIKYKDIPHKNILSQEISELSPISKISLGKISNFTNKSQAFPVGGLKKIGEKRKKDKKTK